MLLPSRPGIGDFLLRPKGFMSRQSLARLEVFFRYRMFLCRDRVGIGGEALCRD